MEKNSPTLTSPTLPWRTWQHLRMMLLTALLAAMTGPTAMAQDTRTLTVYDGTATNTDVPANIYYFDYFTRSQFVIPESELDPLAGGTISSLTFYTTDDNVPYTTTCSADVYLMEVDYTAMTAFEPKASGTTVYQGTLSIEQTDDGGTMTITFSTPYTYGGGNLLIGIENITVDSYVEIIFYGQTVNAAAAWAASDQNSLDNVTGSQQKFIPKTTFTYTPGSNPVYCRPTALTLDDVGATTATLSWTAPSDDVTDYAYQYKPTDTEAWSNEATVTTTTATLSGLTATTAYDFRVKARYDGGESKYATISFNTIVIPVAVGDSWSDDFEGDACGWQLVNGDCANAWAWGTAASSGGTHALYVSNDGGTTNAYNTDSEAMVYAAKTLTFTDGEYEFTYDWLCYGESNYDYLRVALVPATEMLEASQSKPWGFGYKSLPSGWIAVDGGGQLNGTQQWQSKRTAVSGLAAGNYYLVFAWRNDSYNWSDGQPPAAVDNVSIRRVSCAADVDDLTYDYTSGDTATLSWTATGEATQWQVAYSTSSNFAQATEIIVDHNPYTLTNLPLDRTCYVRVRACCGGTDYGTWSETVSFEPTDKHIIGTGTQTSTDLPTKCNYYYSRTQQLYTADEMGATGAIMSIAFKNASARACTRNIDIYMVGTAKSSFESEDDWVGVADDDLVYSGEVTFAVGQWTTITLDTPFEYDGQSNVVIAVNDNTGSYTSSKEFLTFSAENQALYAYDDYNISGGNMGDSKNQLRLGKGELPSVARPTTLTVGYTGGTTATLSWTENGTATEWEICLNGDETNLTSASEVPMQLTGLSYATVYEVKVRAKQGSDVSYWTPATRFTTELCPPEDLCNITLMLTDSRGDGWQGNAIKVVDKLSGIVIGNYANNADAVENVPQTYLVPVPNGRDIQFVWVKGDYGPADCSFSIYDVNGELICRFDKNDNGPAEGLIDTYTVDCSYSPWRTPTALNAVQDIPTTATLSWTERGEATAWVVAYMADGDEAFTEVNVNQNENQNENVVTYTLTGLAGETQYTVKVRPDSGDAGVIKWSDAITFTTIEANPVPTDVNVTAGASKATLSWTAYGDSYNVRYKNKGLVEGFENGLGGWTMMNCLSNTGVYETLTVGSTRNAYHSGKHGFAFAASNNNQQSLISPELSITEGMKLEFYYGIFITGTQKKFRVGFSSATSAINDFNWQGEVTVNNSGWYSYSKDIPAGTKYICIQQTYDSNNYYLLIDDISVYQTDWTTATTTETGITLTGLAPVTTYEYQVQSVRDGDESGWTDLATFTTLQAISIELADNGTANATTLSTCDGEDATVTLSGRTIYADGTWQALCLPFNLSSLSGTPLDGFSVKELDTEGKWTMVDGQWTTSSNGQQQTGLDNDGKVYLHFKDATTIEAGKPYIVRKLVLDEGGTQPTYQATEGTAGSNTNQGFDKLMDGSITGYRWRTNVFPSYCMFETNPLVYVTGYTLITGNQNSNGNPTVWTLEARISESDEWTVIDSRNTNVNSDDALPESVETSKHYTIQQPGAYKFFRFTVKQTKGNTFMCLSELTMQGTPVVESDVVNPVFTGVTIDATAPVTISSQDGQVSITGNYDAVTASGKDRTLFFPGSDSRLFCAQADKTLGACRALFHIGDGSKLLTLGDSNCLKDIIMSEHFIGDADNDGSVTISDAIAVVNHILGNTPAAFNETNADVDASNSITIADAVAIIKMVLAP